MKYSSKGWARRKEERKGFPEFFEKHIKIIKDTKACCEECESRLKGDVSEIAHVLPKSYYKSIATNDINVIYLCGMFSENQCHNKFDNSISEEFKKMNVYFKVSNIFKLLEKEITEKIPYKTYDRYLSE